MPQSADLNMAEDASQNVISSLALLDICRKLKVKRIVFVSSGGTVYGPTSQVPTPETAATDPISAMVVIPLMRIPSTRLSDRFPVLWLITVGMSNNTISVGRSQLGPMTRLLGSAR